ncbi:MAG TPA: hypothetical protein VF199_05265 [Bacillales bacterium]
MKNNERKPEQRKDGEMKEIQALTEEENKERKWQQQKEQNKGGGF